MTDIEAGAPVRWNLVAQYYAIALGGAIIVGAAVGLSGAHLAFGKATPLVQMALAVVYMPLPIVAALIVERYSGEPTLLSGEWGRLKAGWRRVIGVSVVSVAVIWAALVVLTFVLGNGLGVPGVGTAATQQSQLTDNVTALLPPGASPQEVAATAPPVLLMYLLALVSGLAAGFTVNGLFAYFEEYGWRGWLMDELRPLGVWRANLLTGLMWGVWHAPLILLGFDYGQHRIAGVLMMVVWVTPLSFLLWRSREYSGSVVAPAVIHGAFNGFAGFFVFLVAGGDSLVSAPVGLVGAAGCALAAVIVWFAFRPPRGSGAAPA